MIYFLFNIKTMEKLLFFIYKRRKFMPYICVYKICVYKLFSSVFLIWWCKNKYSHFSHTAEKESHKFHLMCYCYEHRIYDVQGRRWRRKCCRRGGWPSSVNPEQSKEQEKYVLLSSNVYLFESIQWKKEK